MVWDWVEMSLSRTSDPIKNMPIDAPEYRLDQPWLKKSGVNGESTSTRTKVREIKEIPRFMLELQKIGLRCTVPCEIPANSLL